MLAPSPKKQTTTLFFFCILKARATPAAMGRFPPTMALATIAPTEMSPVCIAPPLPPQQPLGLAEHLTHHGLDADTLGDIMAGGPMGGGHPVLMAQIVEHTDGAGLLASALVDGAGMMPSKNR